MRWLEGMRAAPARLALVLSTIACTQAALRPGGSTAESEVRLAEEQRFTAMTKPDFAALDTLLDNDLTYVHTSGELQTKAEFVAMLRSGDLVYESISPSEVHFRVHEDMAVANGRSQMRVRSASGESTFEIRFIEVYVRHGRRWLLTAWQSTRLPR